MASRKINAGLSLLTTCFAFYHAISAAVEMLSKGRIASNETVTSWILLGLMALHAFVSIDLAISAHAGIEKRKCKQYPKMNAATMVQRISGCLMIVFTALHVAGAAKLMQPPQIVHAILPPIFFTMVLAHVAVSTSKAFITLGIGNARFVKIVDIVTKVLCVATLIAAVIGFYTYQLNGGAA